MIIFNKFQLTESEFYPFAVSIDITSRDMKITDNQNELIHNINVWLNDRKIESLQCMRLTSHIWGFKTESDRLHMLLAWS
jgi:hypothetical protein